jgi:hypothetical protein
MATPKPNPRPKADANTPRPDWIRCAGTVFDIEWYPTQDELQSAIKEGDLSKDDAVMAVTDRWDNRILMGCWMSLDLQRTNLLHEVMHAIMGVVRPEMDALPDVTVRHADDFDWEEWFCALWDAPLVNTLRDNPSVTKWILGGA